MITLSHRSYPKTIQQLRAAVLIATVLFALWSNSFMQGNTAVSPILALLSPSLTWAILWQPITSSLIIPYSNLGLDMVFDLLLLNFILVPITSFVYTFLEHKYFTRFLLAIVLIGTIFHLQFGHNSCSLFGPISFAFIIFWFLVHREGRSTLFIAVPISRYWVLAIACLVLLPQPFFAGDWARISLISSLGASTYLWGVCSWHLRSHIPHLMGFERWIDKTYQSCVRFLEWKIARPIRSLFRKN